MKTWKLYNFSLYMALELQNCFDFDCFSETFTSGFVHYFLIFTNQGYHEKFTNNLCCNVLGSLTTRLQAFHNFVTLLTAES